MDFDQRLAAMGGQAGAEASPRHGVPLIAVSAGVEGERPMDEGVGKLHLPDRNQSRPAVPGRDVAVGKRGVAPAERLQRVIIGVGVRAGTADVDTQPAYVTL